MYGKKVYIKLHEPNLSKSDLKEVNRSIKNNYVSTIGNVVKLFEKELKKVTKSKYVITTVNGTAAIHLAVILSKTKPNEEILMPTLNYIASANATMYCNAVPHFLDIDRETLTIDPIKLEKYLSRNTIIKNKQCFNKKTKRKITAIIVLHPFGHPAKMDKIIKISKKFKLFVIEDAAESLGSYYLNKHTGTFGNVGILSFNGNKIITTGGGGALLTNSAKLAKKALHLISNSKINHKWKYNYDQVGYNYKMPGINAALGLSQIKKLKLFLKSKRALYNKYNNLFKDIDEVKVLREPKNSKSNYWLQTILIKNNSIQNRDYIIDRLNKSGFAVRPVWTLLHKVSYLSKYPKMNLINATLLEKQIINLPSSSQLLKRIYV